MELYVDLGLVEGIATVKQFDKNSSRGQLLAIMLKLIELIRLPLPAAGQQQPFEEFVEAVCAENTFLLTTAMQYFDDAQAIGATGAADASGSADHYDKLGKSFQGLLLDNLEKHMQLASLTGSALMVAPLDCSHARHLMHACTLLTSQRAEMLKRAGNNDWQGPEVLSATVMVMARLSENGKARWAAALANEPGCANTLQAVSNALGGGVSKSSTHSTFDALVVATSECLAAKAALPKTPANTTAVVAAADASEDDEDYAETMRELVLDEFDMAGNDGDYSGHHYRRNITDAKKHTVSNALAARLGTEIPGLLEALPCAPEAAVYARCDEEQMSVLKVIITGPADTPYSLGCFLFDAFLPREYPNIPPVMSLQTTGRGLVRFNPNLYSDGKVCLSLLGTWHGEGWDPSTSTLLQIMVSIQSLIMVEEPYFNEPSYETHRGTEVGQRQSQMYSARIQLGTLQYAVLAMLRDPPAEFEDVVENHFRLVHRRLLVQAEQWSQEGAVVDPELASKFEHVVNEIRDEFATRGWT